MATLDDVAAYIGKNPWPAPVFDEFGRHADTVALRTHLALTRIRGSVLMAEPELGPSADKEGA